MLPYYLVKKLSNFNIKSVDDLRDFDPIQIFQWLKFQYPSITYQVLFDLYSLHNNHDTLPLSLEIKTFILNKYKAAIPSYPRLPNKTIQHYLEHADKAAKQALERDEIPIGSVIVYDKIPNAQNIEDFKLIGQGYNLTLTNSDICAHAEIIAIKEASRYLNNHRLNNCDLYVTLEPCLMCMGAILHSRIRRVIFGACEPKTGAIISQYKVLENNNCNHQTEAIGPIDNAIFGSTLQSFMHKKRLK